MNIYCLRVDRNKAGKTVPFDRVYLVKHQDRGVISKLWKYALVMPMNGELQTRLETLTIDEYTDRTFDRDDEVARKASYPHDDWKDLLNETDWLVVVPILTKYVGKAVPKYLIAASWYRHTESGKRQSPRNLPGRSAPFPTLSYMQTPTRKIRPICVACPNFIFHQNGACKLGEPICYEKLSLGVQNHFADGTRVDEPTTNVKEPLENAT